MDRKVFGLFLGILLVSFASAGFVSANHVYTYPDGSYDHEISTFTQGDVVYGKGYAADNWNLKIEYHYTNNATVLKECTSSGKVMKLSCDWTDAPAGTWIINLYSNENSCGWQKIATNTFTVNPHQNTPVCGNNITESGEECDYGLNNGVTPWTPYGTSNTYCSSSCKIKTINGGFCGDGVIQSCEQCDGTSNCLGNCTLKIPTPTCDYDAGINYGYGHSDNTGINVGIGSNWIDDTPVNLTNNESYNVKIAIKNLGNEEIQNVYVKVKVDGNDFYSEYKDLAVSTSAKYVETELNTSLLICGLHTISVEISKENKTDCNINDNTASRQIYVECSTPVLPICGDGIINQASEECDLGNLNGNTCSSLGYDKGTLSCSSSCTLDTSLCENNSPQTSSRKNLITTLEYTECIPNWECSGWSECSNGGMTRTCADTNFCDYQYNKPIESSECTMQKSLVEEKVNNHLGLFFTGVLVLILLLLILINLRR